MRAIIFMSEERMRRKEACFGVRFGVTPLPTEGEMVLLGVLETREACRFWKAEFSVRRPGYVLWAQAGKSPDPSEKIKKYRFNIVETVPLDDRWLQHANEVQKTSWKETMAYAWETLGSLGEGTPIVASSANVL